MDDMEEATSDLALDKQAGEALVLLARHSLVHYLTTGEIMRPDLAVLPLAASQPRATFVTLTNQGRLRGCMGHTEAKHPLAVDVAQNAVAAASRDPRFNPVDESELADIRLEVTVLTPMQPLAFDSYEHLLTRLRPGLDGVMISQDWRRGLLLPQVWERVTDPDEFLAVIADKAGISQRDLHQRPPKVRVHVFQVQTFQEAGYREPGG